MKGKLFSSLAAICDIRIRLDSKHWHPTTILHSVITQKGIAMGKKKRSQFCKSSPFHQLMELSMVKVKQSRYKPGVAQRVPGS